MNSQKENENRKECYECKHCSIEDLWHEYICLKRNKNLCPTEIVEDEDGCIEIYYPACEEFEGENE